MRRPEVTQTALVVGGSSAIGSEIVRTLVRDGFRVAATYYKGRKAAEGLLASCGPDAVSIFPMDVANPESVDKTMRQVLAGFRVVDAVVYSVSAPIGYSPVFSLEWKSFEDHFNLQVKGLFHVTKGLEAQIKSKHRTKILVLLTAACVTRPPSRMADYLAAKHALLGFCRSLAVELGRFNCSVNMVSPGLTPTPLVAKLPAKAVELAAQANPLGRVTGPKDIAETVSFLASDRADYVNGANLLVNGGAETP